LVNASESASGFVRSEPANAGWQRALRHLRAAVQVRSCNAERQRDLSVTYDSLAVVYAKSTQMRKAREALPDSTASKQELTRWGRRLAAFKN
jgi:hypothetical protein